MNKNTVLISIVVLVVVAGALYWSSLSSLPSTTNQSPVLNSGENPQPGDTVHGLPAEPAAVAARKDLAGKLAISESSIVIMRVQEQTWNNGCLGLGGASEFCTEALVEGFRVELLANGKSYFYHTDKTGASLRLETL